MSEERKDVTVKAWSEDYPDIPILPNEFIKFWQDRIDLVPEEYKDSTTVNIEADAPYECAKLYSWVSYRRPETDEEYDRRIEKEGQEQKRLEKREQNLLAHLKDKYEGKE